MFWYVTEGIRIAEREERTEIAEHFRDMGAILGMVTGRMIVERHADPKEEVIDG